MEQAVVSGVANDASRAKITVINVPDQVGAAAHLFHAVAQADINVDMIVQNVSRAGAGRADISFTLPMDDAEKAKAVLDRLQPDLGFDHWEYDDRVAKVSIVGSGMRTHSGVASTLFAALAEAGVNLDMISTSDVCISVMVHSDDMVRAVRAAHTAFELDGEGEAIVYAGTGR